MASPMTRNPRHKFSEKIVSPLQAWAMRDLLRRPAETLLLLSALTLIVIISATALLLTQSLTTTAKRLLAEAPSLVVRGIGPGGWQPLDSASAVSSAMAVPGVTSARPRVWGVVDGPDGPVTVVGAAPQRQALMSEGGIRRLPGHGEAVIGSGVNVDIGGTLHLAGAAPAEFTVTGHFSPQADVAANDIVLLHAEDAGKLLGLPQGYASDLAVYVYHEAEETAILPELVEAFARPVHITTRRQAAGYYAAAASKNGGLSFLATGSALFSMLLIVWFVSRERSGRRREVGLLKSLGWTTGDIVTLQLYRALLVALPAAAIGGLAAYALVFRSGVTWPGFLLLGWQTSPPALYLDTVGAWTILLEIAALVVLPFVAAALFPALRSAAAAPLDLFDEGSS